MYRKSARKSLGIQSSSGIRKRQLTISQSQLRTSMAPEISPYPVGTSCLRWLLPIEDLKKDECTKSYVNEPGLFLEFSAKDRRLVAYPCSNNKILNICAFMPSVEAQVDGQTDGEP